MVLRGFPKTSFMRKKNSIIELFHTIGPSRVKGHMQHWYSSPGWLELVQKMILSTFRIISDWFVICFGALIYWFTGCSEKKCVVPQNLSKFGNLASTGLLLVVQKIASLYELLYTEWLIFLHSGDGPQWIGIFFLEHPVINTWQVPTVLLSSLPFYYSCWKKWY